MPKNNKNYIGLIATIVMIIIIGGIYYLYQKSNIDIVNKITGNTPKPSISLSPTITPTVAVSPKPSPKNTPSPSPKLTYTEATNKYKNFRFQFDTLCHSSPAKLIIKNGTEIMFDNRDEKEKIISIDGKEYNLSGYDFKIIKISTTKTLPYLAPVNCGSGVNVAQIVIN